MDIKLNFNNWTTANSSQDNEIQDDVHKSSSFIVVSIVSSIISIIIATPLHLGVIFFEKYGSDKKRTLVNKLLSSICWYVIIWNFSIQAISIYRFSGGPVSGNYNCNSSKLSLEIINKFFFQYFRSFTDLFR